MSTKLLTLYKSMMATAGLTVTEDHLVSGRIMGQVFPVTINGKRLALPSDDILRRGDKNEIVVFHPLNEQITRGESDVLEKYRKALMLHFNDIAASLMTELLVVSGDVASQKDLTPDQTEFLVKVKGIDDALLRTWARVIEAMPHEQSARRIITLFLKKTGSVAGKRHKRVGVVSFPLYDELKKPPVVLTVAPSKKGDKETKKNEYDIYGVKCRAKDKEILIALHEYLFPGIDVVGSYNRGSDSDVAANLDALMKSALAVIQVLNSVSETFEDVIKKPDVDDLYIECDWQNDFNNLDALMTEIRKVPMQAGNEGATIDDTKDPHQTPKVGLHVPEVAHQAQQQMLAVQPAPQQPVYHQPVQAPVQPQQMQHPGSPAAQPLDSFLAQREQERERQRALEQGWQRVSHMAPAPQVQPAYYNPAAPFMAQPHPGMMQPGMMPVPMQPVNTGRGLDFGSVLAANPGVLYATGGPGMQQQAPQVQTSRFFQQFINPGMQQPQQQQGYYPQMNTGYQRTV